MLEEVYGDFKFTEAQFLTIKKLLTNTWLSYVDTCFEAACNIADSIAGSGQEKISQELIDFKMEKACTACGLPVSINQGDAESPMQRLLNRNSNGQFSNLTDKLLNQLKSSKVKDKGAITFQCTLGHLTLDIDNRSVTWSVASDHNAVSISKEHPVAKAFFARLNRVRWSNVTGGYCRFIDDSLRSDRVGLGYQFTHCVGAHARQFQPDV